MSKPKVLNRKSFCIASLRRSSMRWPPRNQAITNARVARGLYRCNICKREDVKNSEKKLDHIEPVIDPKEGFVGFDSFIERLLPFESSAYQVLCPTCHDSKTKVEKELRKIVKAKNKVKK